MPNESDKPLMPSQVPSQVQKPPYISTDLQAWLEKVRAHTVRMDTDPEYRKAIGKRVR